MSSLTNEEFIKRCVKKHGGKYDYSITNYVRAIEKIKYICPKHGVVEQNAYSHLSGTGCPHCAVEENHNKSRYTTEKFIMLARKVHGDKYDYSNVDYKNSQTKVAIICHKKDALGNEHGVFYQKPYSHLQGFNCPICRGMNKTSEQWIAEAKSIYPEGKYTFEKTNYTHARDKVIVTCKEHGDFLTLPRDFLRGHGCPKCNMPKLEINIEKALNENNIPFKMQVKFKWLNGMSFDFYLPDYKIAIECQGEQHYINKEFFDKREDLKERQKRDFQKRQLCKENGVELIYFLEPKFEEYETSGNKYFINVDDLIDYIKEQVPIE